MTISDIPVFSTIAELRAFRKKCFQQNLSVGFVPTMGSLHKGHLTLVSNSLKQNDVTVVSIFVNPSQFSPSEDLESYPRSLNNDLNLLDSVNVSNKKVSCVFTPSVSEMYPSGIPLDKSLQKGAFVEVIGFSEQLEGKSRPHFFRGVATIVTKLFNVVLPTTAYFGQKDIQQYVVIKRLVKDLLIGTEIKIVGIVREDSGLALSSRNLYLSDEVKSQSTVISKGLKICESLYTKNFGNGESTSVKELRQIVLDLIKEQNSSFEIDYVSINDLEDLRYLDDEEKIDYKIGAVLSLAVKVPNDLNDATKGHTRLLDNLIFDTLE